MTKQKPNQASKSKAAGEGARTEQKATTFTPADARRLDIYAAREDRSVAYLIHRAVIADLDAHRIEDDGVRA